jgi:hypothetical protein
MPIETQTPNTNDSKAPGGDTNPGVTQTQETQPKGVETPSSPGKRMSAREYAQALARAENKVDLNAQVEVPDDEGQPFDMEAFMNQDFSDDPILSREHKNLPDFKTVLSRHTTEEGRKLISNMRADYTRKTQEIASMRKELEAERATLQRERELLLRSPTAKANAELAAKDTSKLDPYIETDLKELIRIEAAKIALEQIKPYQEDQTRREQTRAAQAFIEAHPELKEESFKQEMIKTLKEKPHLNTEDAYELTAARVAKAKAAKQVEEKNALKKAGQDYYKSDRGSNVRTVSIGYKSAREHYKELIKQ